MSLQKKNPAQALSRSGLNEASKVGYRVKLPEQPTEEKLSAGLTSFQGQLARRAGPEMGDKTKQKKKKYSF